MGNKSSGSEHSKQYSDEIWVNEFTENSASEFREQIRTISERDSERPIIIYIDSYGGYVDSLAKMLETMNEVPNKFITVCMGKAVSCGAILLSHGDVRYCGELSRVMIHNISAGSWGDVYSMKAQGEEAMRMNKCFMTLLAKNCSMTYEELQNKIKSALDSREIWLDAEGARKFKIIDEIGTPLVTPNIGWECRSIRSAPVAPAKKKTTKKKTTKKKTVKKKKTTKRKRS